VEPNPQPPFVSIARIVRARGIRGEVVADSYSDFPERFSRLKHVWLEFPNGSRVLYPLERAWEHKGRPVLKLGGVDTMSAAETLVGAWVQVGDADTVELPKDTYFDHDLTGCLVEDPEGRVLGSVVEVLRLSGNHQLIVRGESREFMVPLTGAMCREISVSAKRIVVDLPEGLIDLNE
jgi:16S rRNA processing protein RimM